MAEGNSVQGEEAAIPRHSADHDESIESENKLSSELVCASF